MFHFCRAYYEWRWINYAGRSDYLATLKILTAFLGQSLPQFSTKLHSVKYQTIMNLLPRSFLCRHHHHHHHHHPLQYYAHWHEIQHFRHCKIFLTVVFFFLFSREYKSNKKKRKKYVGRYLYNVGLHNRKSSNLETGSLKCSKLLRHKYEPSSPRTYMSPPLVPKQCKILEQIYNTKTNLVSNCCFLFIHRIKSRYN